MRKRDWFRSTDPRQMVWAALAHRKASARTFRTAMARKFRLFTLLAGNRLWQQLDSEPCRAAVEVAWRLAEGNATAEEAEEQYYALMEVYREADATNMTALAGIAVVLAFLFREPDHSARVLVGGPLRLRRDVEPVQLLDPAERSDCCGLLRELFGSLHARARLDPAWLSWAGATVPQLARAVYAEQAFDRLPVLADALEEAGCANPDLLGHLRGPGPHVRGCWALDLVLGKG